jgi:hypothetical protein
VAKPQRSRARVASGPGTLTPERKDRVNRQLQLELEDVADAPPAVALSVELQEQLVILMADAIAAMVAPERGDDE